MNVYSVVKVNTGREDRIHIYNMKHDMKQTKGMEMITYHKLVSSSGPHCVTSFLINSLVFILKSNSIQGHGWNERRQQTLERVFNFVL